ncbi:hypothetical protein BCR37DRAFT_379522 [Protomyces lactucae-debilis]|uniref:ADP-ribosylation factor GTPase-activating protein n=1 Tax=Protomyces lactucae-debilis TaxID=2754530 RepID=A0A1Y2FGX2_PROLT|nr:uncharacterized protein BCR37DRAFT_379522 [Protomyces lactucae-debilis]ORY82526.1 hypothetical protein BCR37DRAFT_379522 [Protomyces lactucae-debilis]
MRYTVMRDQAPVEFVQDPEAAGLPVSLLKLTQADNLEIKFTFTLKQGALSGFTFATGSCVAEIERLFTAGYHADSNIQKHKNVRLLGHYNAGNGDFPVEIEYIHQWTPDSVATHGWKCVCSFAEFNAKENRFSTLAFVPFWVQHRDIDEVGALPKRPSRLAMPSYSSSAEDSHRPESPDIMTPGLESAPAFEPLMSLTTQADEDETPDDGPVFRATLAGLEGKTAAFRLRVKKLIKRASEAREYYRAWSEAQQRLQQSMFAIADTNPSAMKPILDSYLGTAFQKLCTFRDYEDRLLQLYIIDPLRKLYEQDIKAAEGKKREFEEESRDYYAFVSRYLSKKHDASKKLEKDGKYSTRRKNFELKRFDYYCYMQDLHGGRKEQEVLRQMTLFSEKQSDALLKVGSTIQELKPALDGLLLEVENARNDFRLARTEREEKRRLIEKNEEQDEPIEAEARRKEGILWALAKPGLHTDPKVVQKLNWHKFWVVLAGGQISEYRDWKEGVNHTGDPIDLRMATVRVARNVDRRFCFEIITPHIKRVYQTTGEEELESWIKHITAAIEGLLDGSASQKSFDIERVQHNREVKQTGGNAGAIFGSSGSRRSTLSTELLRNNKEDARRLLSVLRDADPMNGMCADCGSTSKVEWCSINLAVILCIECSGVHRSLGSHISKVRSLTMDSSFNADLVDLMCQIGNRVSNAIYEATLCRINAALKPTDKSTPETRTRFITAKYVDRSFVEYPSISPNDVLLGSLASGNVSAAYGALASRADPNVVDEHGQSALLLSLMSLSPPSSPTTTASGFTLRDESTFPLAELLIQHGAELPADTSKLSQQAKNYISGKFRQEAATVAPLQRSISNANASIVNGAHKLQKRISSSGQRMMLKQQPAK